ncbi:MAG: DUF2269 domain-containing protein [Hyphomicrobiales bacterium]
MADAALFVKWLHVLSSTILFGTGIGIAYFFWFAVRGPDLRAAAAVARLVVKADWTFTATAGLVQATTGGLLVWLNGWSLTDRWLMEAIGIFVLALACWLPVVWLQIRLRDMLVQAEASQTPLPPHFRRYLWTWFALGWPAFIGLVYVFWLMVAKPD